MDLEILHAKTLLRILKTIGTSYRSYDVKPLQHGAAVARCLRSRHGSARSSTATAAPLPRSSFGEGKAELGLDRFKGQPQHCRRTAAPPMNC